MLDEKIFDDNSPLLDKHYFSIERNNSNNYSFGRYDEKERQDGLVVTIDKFNFGRFAKYERGEIVYPYLEVSVSGHLTAYLKKDGDKIYVVEVDPEKGGFEYYLMDTNKNRLGASINYDGINNSFSFKKYDAEGEHVEEGRISRKFVVNSSLMGVCPLLYPSFETTDSLAVLKFDIDGFSTLKENQVGIGCWNDGTYYLSNHQQQYRSGWMAYQFKNAFAFFNGRGTSYAGMELFHDVSSGITRILYATDVEYSAQLTFDGSFLEFSDSSTFEREEGDSIARMIAGKEIIFTKVGASSSSLKSKDIFNVKDYLKGAEEEKKEVVDENDPEYQMLSLVGQNEAKKEFVRIRAYIQKNEASKIYKHMVFTGENGVGKSTVAKLIAKVLYKYKAISSDSYVERSARELFNQFTGETTIRITELYKLGKGGVILIDDLHYLNGMNSSNIVEGYSIISKLMAEDPATVFILVDNKYNMNQILEDNKLLFMNMIRFRVDFKDFTREELEQILTMNLSSKGYSITEEAMRALLDIIYLSKSYGNNINARAAISILEEIIVAQNVRTIKENNKTINLDDVKVYIVDHDIAFIDQKTGGQSEARKRLDELVGLEEIKETVDDLIAYFSINRGKKVDFHMCFTGNPGTGKTEVARIIGKLLREEGILGSTKFIEVTRADLVGQYLGQSAIMTRDIIDKSMGGVLYIDEAYSLAYGGEKDYGKEVVAELLKAMEDRRGEFCVIMAGYTSEMKRLFDLNPGFKSRVKFDLNFPDYSDEELNKIARLFIKKDKYIMSDENIDLMVKLVSYERQFPNFANVRTLREYLSRVQIKQARRIRLSQEGTADASELTYEDIVKAFSEEQVNRVLGKVVEEVKPTIKINPAVLKERDKDYIPLPFMEKQEEISECILALKAKGITKNGESTGFIISKDGYFLTCAHCVNDAYEVEARRRLIHHNRKVDINYEVEVISVNKEDDIAICKLIHSDNEEFDYLTLASEEEKLEKLDQIYLLGYPFGVSRFDDLSITQGRIASYQNKQINLDIQAKGGNSGSPVIDAKTSKVFGILVGSEVSRGDYLTEEINFCRQIKFVWDYMKKEFEEDQKNENNN